MRVLPVEASRTTGLLVAAALAWPLVSFVRTPDTLLWTAICGGLLAVWATEPPIGLGALLLLLPLTPLLQLTSRQRLSGADITDALVIASAAGAAMGLGSLGRPPRNRSAPATGEHGSRLAAPALVLGTIVVASAIAQFSVQQARMPSRSVLRDIAWHLTTGYWTGQGSMPVLHLAWRWCALLLLAVAAERVLVKSPRVRHVMPGVWLAAAAIGSLFAVVRLVEITRQLDLPIFPALRWIVTHVRESLLHPDVNAAGSYFSMFVVAAVVIGLRRRSIWRLAAVLPLVSVAFLLAGSRAAMAAVAVVLGVRWCLILARSRRVAIGIAAAVGVVLALAAGLFVATGTHASLGVAATIRVQLLEVGLRAAERRPVWGAGLGNYIKTTRPEVTPDLVQLLAFAPQGENAHNNFLQILVELGAPALVAFVWLVAAAALAAWTGRQTRDSPEAEGLSLAVGAFLVTALFGHPLLIAQVAAMFFVTVGLASGAAPPENPPPAVIRRVLPVLIAAVVVSIAWRTR